MERPACVYIFFGIEMPSQFKWLLSLNCISVGGMSVVNNRRRILFSRPVEGRQNYFAFKWWRARGEDDTVGW